MNTRKRINFTEPQLNWAGKKAEELDITFNELIRRVIDAYRFSDKCMDCLRVAKRYIDEKTRFTEEDVREIMKIAEEEGTSSSTAGYIKKVVKEQKVEDDVPDMWF